MGKFNEIKDLQRKTFYESNAARFQPGTADFRARQPNFLPPFSATGFSHLFQPPGAPCVLT
jgi:hypothetical protein